MAPAQISHDFSPLVNVRRRGLVHQRRQELRPVMSRFLVLANRGIDARNWDARAEVSSLFLEGVVSSCVLVRFLVCWLVG